MSYVKTHVSEVKSFQTSILLNDRLDLLFYGSCDLVSCQTWECKRNLISCPEKFYWFSWIKKKIVLYNLFFSQGPRLLNTQTRPHVKTSVFLPNGDTQSTDDFACPKTKKVDGRIWDEYRNDRAVSSVF